MERLAAPGAKVSGQPEADIEIDRSNKLDADFAVIRFSLLAGAALSRTRSTFFAVSQPGR